MANGKHEKEFLRSNLVHAFGGKGIDQDAWDAAKAADAREATDAASDALKALVDRRVQAELARLLGNK